MAKLDHVLGNGCTYMAVTTGYYGSWAKATDPITAIRNAANADGCSGKRPVVVRCVYGLNEDLSVDEMGAISYSLLSHTVPIGLFIVTPTTIKPLKKGKLNDKHESHEEWVDNFNKDQERQKANLEKRQAAA